MDIDCLYHNCKCDQYLSQYLTLRSSRLCHSNDFHSSRDESFFENCWVLKSMRPKLLTGIVWSATDHSRGLNFFSQLIGHQFSIKVRSHADRATTRGSTLCADRDTGAHVSCFLGRLVDALVCLVAQTRTQFSMQATDQQFVDVCCLGFPSSDRPFDHQNTVCWDGGLYFTNSVQVGMEGAPASATAAAW